MQTFTSVLSVVALTFALGCGDDGGGDGGGGTVDASTSPTIDAQPSGPDAMPGSAPITTGVGEICQTADSVCTSAVTNGCVSFTEGATTGLCTFQCATDIAMGATPEASASQMCAAEYSGTTGTPLCVINIGPGAGVNTTNYACGIACGMIGDPATDLGNCPGTLTCTNNICTP